MKKKIVIAAGSTGGHFFPALNIARHSRKKYKIESVFVGPIKSKFRNILKKEKFSFVDIPISSACGSMIAAISFYYPSMLKAFFKSFFSLCRLRPKLVIGTGSFGSFPACMSAYLLGIPLFLQEQNVVSGKANRFLAKFAKKIFLAFPDFSLNSAKTLVVGNPVGKSVPNINKQTCYGKFGFDEDKKTLLIFGGSQGAFSLNSWVTGVLAKLDGFKNWQVIHVAGEADYKRMKKEYEKMKIHSVVLPFLFPMDYAYLISDLAIARGGALSLSELSFWGVPSLIVPYSYAKDNHQEYNARYFQKRGGTYLLTETDMGENHAPKILQELLNNPDKLKKMGENMKKIMPGDALRKICEEIYGYVETEEFKN